MRLPTAMALRSACPATDMIRPSSGRPTFICWRGVMENPWIAVPLGAAVQHVEMPPPPNPNDPGPFSFADADRVRGILQQAGLENIEINPHDVSWPMAGGGDIEESLDFLFEIGPMARLTTDTNEETMLKVRESVTEALLPFQNEQGFMMPTATWLVSATK